MPSEKGVRDVRTGGHDGETIGFRVLEPRQHHLLGDTLAARRVGHKRVEEVQALVALGVAQKRFALGQLHRKFLLGFMVDDVGS